MTRLRFLIGRVLVGSIPVLVVGNTFARVGSLRLATTDTVLIVSAGANRPGVLSVATPGGKAWSSQNPQQSLIDKVQLDGEWKPVRWRLESVSNDASHDVRAVYSSSKPRLRLYWEWRARARSGPLEHFIRIENLESRAVGLPLQDTLNFDWRVPAPERLRHMWIEKGAGRPSPEGTHEVVVADTYSWQGTSSTYARDGPGDVREPIPWLLVETAERSGWYLGIEFSGRTRLGLSRKGDILVRPGGP